MNRADRVTVNISDRNAWLQMRRRNVGASDVGALFHANPHKTALRLWAEKRGALPPDEEDNQAMRRGRILEPAVAEALRDAHPDWVIVAARQYVELTNPRLGCTPDFYAWPSREACDAGRDMFLIQAKTVLADVYEDEWTPAPPAHYLLQIQAEMLITGIRRACLAPLVLDGNAFPVFEYHFDYDSELGDQIEAGAAKFWACVEEGREPKLKHVQDGATLGALFPIGEPEPVLALHGDEGFVRDCRAYKAVSAQITALQEQKDALACRVMDKLRNHSKAEAQDFRVSWTTIAGGQRVQNVKPHRRLTINQRKGTT
jgi:putative phage-type endonuclease